jgi:hypothetical protein
MKILGVGLGRSATKSLAAFLVKNGFKTIHFYNSDEIKGTFTENINGIINYFNLIENDTEAFTDIPYCFIYEYFFKKYPDAKFIYIKRDVDSWVESMYEINKIWSYSGEGYIFEEAYCNMYKKTNKKRIQDLTKNELRNIWIEHDKAITEFFKNNKNFIEISLDDKEIANKLCSFLTVDFFKSFPKINTRESIKRKSFNGN